MRTISKKHIMLRYLIFLIKGDMPYIIALVVMFMLIIRQLTFPDTSVPREPMVKTENVRQPEIFIQRVRPESLDTYLYFQHKLGDIPISIDDRQLILYDEYRVFITAYCAEECGWSYSTSSGETCHRSSWEDRYEPTTCAIDRSYFSYGTMFYIPSEDRVYIAEDTGPGVKGYWIDTYQDDMSDVIGYNTRYEYVYTCEIIDSVRILYVNGGIKDVNNYMRGYAK